MPQDIIGPLTIQGSLGVSGGFLELGQNLLPDESPYIDFHFGSGAVQDYNVRLVNYANNRLDFVTESGGTVLSINGSNVGIGPMIPVAAKLVVSDTTAAELRVDGNSGAFGLTLGADSNHPWIGSRTNHALRLLTNNTEQMRVQADGRVGIGTTGPDTRLNVNASAPNSQAVLAVSNGNADTRLALWSGFSAGANPPAILYTHDLRFGINGAPDFAAGSSFAEAMRITSRGNVGIGTPSPNTKLDVAGGLQILTGSNPIRFTSNWIGFPSAVANGAEISNDTSLYKTLMIVGNYSAGMGRRVSVWDRLEVNGTFMATGNVGIGTTEPRTQLHVLGRIATGRDFVSAGAITFYPPDGFAWFHIDNGPAGGRPLGRLRFSHGGNPGDHEIMSIDQNRNVFIHGRLIAPQKQGYVIDQFVNKLDEALEQGDVVVIGENQSSLSYGPNNIPIPEIAIAQRAYDTRVCGIVDEVHAFLQAEQAANTAGESDRPGAVQVRDFAPEALEKLDRAKVGPGQLGGMVTLGAFAHCKVDADIAPVVIGDLLTTSPTKGHAQKVLDPGKAVGAILGKALGSLEKGKEKIPVLVMLQ